MFRPYLVQLVLPLQFLLESGAALLQTGLRLPDPLPLTVALVTATLGRLSRSVTAILLMEGKDDGKKGYNTSVGTEYCGH